MSRWRKRTLALCLGFICGLLAFCAYAWLAGRFAGGVREAPEARAVASSCETCVAPGAGCEAGFKSPEEVLSALQSTDVGVRREIHRRLFLQPGLRPTFYDYERDWNYPERAEHGRVRYVNLDESPEPEALITFVRYESPVALVLAREDGCWKARAALSSWLRFEDYPYDEWLELVEAVSPGRYELLLHESEGDATRYLRRARLLRLAGGALTQLAAFDEEAITPVAGYGGADWSSVKQREQSRYELLPAGPGRPARLLLHATREVVRYDGDVPSYTFWRELDGAWHTEREHWRRRPCARLRTLAAETESFVWDARTQRFVEERKG